jgi:hypothetical protein
VAGADLTCAVRPGNKVLAGRGLLPNLIPGHTYRCGICSRKASPRQTFSTPLFLHLVARASNFRAACFHFFGLAASVVFACGTCLTPILFLQQKQDQYAVGDFMTRREDLVVVEASTTVDEGTGPSLPKFLWSEAPPWKSCFLDCMAAVLATDTFAMCLLVGFYSFGAFSQSSDYRIACGGWYGQTGMVAAISF